MIETIRGSMEQIFISDCETPVAACSGWADPVAGFYAEHDFRQNH